VAQTLVDRVFTKIGCPLVVTSDRGRQFISKVFQDLADLIGFSHWPTTAYHQQANGQAERAVGIIRRMLAPYLIDNQKEWDTKLQLLVFAYNNSVNTVTKETPYYLTHGFDPIMPMDLALKINNETIDLVASEFKQSLATNIRDAWKSAAENIWTEQEKQKLQYDQRHNVEYKEFKIGDLVLKRANIDTKFSVRWNGPYRLIGEKGSNVFIEMKGKAYEIHKDKVKKFVGPGVLPLRELKTGYEKVEGKKMAADKNLEESESEIESEEGQEE
jgi:hypothetical protein